MTTRKEVRKHVLSVMEMSEAVQTHLEGDCCRIRSVGQLVKLFDDDLDKIQEESDKESCLWTPDFRRTLA